MSVTAGVSNDETLGLIYSTQLLTSYYPVENLALEYGGIVAYAETRRTPPGVLGGPELGVSWYFAKGARWATYRLSHDTSLQGGLRWHHLCNAQVRGRRHNYGYDGPLLYLGLTRSF